MGSGGHRCRQELCRSVGRGSIAGIQSAGLLGMGVGGEVEGGLGFVGWC